MFTASVDHATLTNYLLEVFSSTANTATATALTSSNLGKPAPNSSKEISVDRTTFERTPKPSAAWLASVVRANALVDPPS